MVNIRKFIPKFFIGHSILATLIVTSLFIPLSAKASVFSFFIDLFSPAHVEADETLPVNSQNIALLQASISPNYNATSTDREVTIVSETSISPETFSGTEGKSGNADQISIYVVHPGDTLPAIAKMFNVSVNTIRWGNNLAGNTVRVGDTLVILPISGVQHTVKAGDTLQSIAKLHKGDLDEILQYNNLSRDSKLALGDVIIVPDGEAASTSSNGGSTGSVKSTSSTPSYAGYYMRPIVGGTRTQGVHGHNGVDLASYYGANILASAEGDVIISRNSGWNGGYGSYVVLRHANGTQTLYAHLSATTVSAGEHVNQGQIIGRMGNSGDVRGPTGIHLHFEIRGARNPF
jgi:LysM repeat protein